MGERLAAKGLDGLVESAINGLNAMPPRGGSPSLTDEQIRASVEFMLP
jgi:cytochrome c5